MYQIWVVQINMKDDNNNISQIKQGITVLKAQLALMPDKPGVYKMIGQDDQLLYIGKAKVLAKRVASYTDLPKLPNRLKMMVSQIRKVEFIITNSESEALLLEANLITKFKPRYNINLKDDKSFPYIFFEDTHIYPRITKYRGNKLTKGSYYGPFASAGQVKQVIGELQKVFLIRPCSNAFFSSRTRPCIQYEIKRCSAPCVGKISESDYKKQIDLAKDFLKGDDKQVHSKLIQDMESASNALDFERAAQIRDRIKVLSSIQAKNIITDIAKADLDIIAIYKKSGAACIQVYFIRSGKNFGNKSYYYDDLDDATEAELLYQFLIQFYQMNIPMSQTLISNDLEDDGLLANTLKDINKKKIIISTPKNNNHKDLMEFALYNAKMSLEKHLKERIQQANILISVSKLFNIAHPIRRIEVYDNSHHSGTNAVGCMVVYAANGFDKNQYRQFNIKTTTEPDDYLMLREVLIRRLKNLSDANKPDLMLIDGGKGHLSTALEVFALYNINDIALACISKGEDRNAGREFFHMNNQDAFQLPRGDHTLHFLQVLRDEVHRYAITSHRNKRAREMNKSSLDLIPKIGDSRKKALLQHFGSVECVLQASIDDLSNVKGISKITAKSIFNYLHPAL